MTVVNLHLIYNSSNGPLDDTFNMALDLPIKLYSYREPVGC